jgi:hypothetical protein
MRAKWSVYLQTGYLQKVGRLFCSVHERSGVNIFN